jgi:signal transduction histidine kinase
MTEADEALSSEDHRANRRLLLLGVGVMGTAFALGVTAQSMLVLGIGSISIGGQTPPQVIEAAMRISVNLATVASIGALAVWWRLHVRGFAAFLGLSACIALLAATFRTLLQLLIGVHLVDDPRTAISDALITLPVGLIILLVAGTLVELNRRATRAERERLRAATDATEALTADTLHGTMQHRLVVIEAELTAIADRLSSESGVLGTELRDRMRDLSTDLDTLRERDLRALSIALYPEALNRGIVPAMRALTDRIPSSISVDFSAEGFAEPDGLDRTSRLLLVRVAEEGISNALRHGKAEKISLRIERLTSPDGDTCRVHVQHFGQPPKEPLHLSGLARLQRRLAQVQGGLLLEPEPRGATLHAWVPLAGLGAPSLAAASRAD